MNQDNTNPNNSFKDTHYASKSSDRSFESLRADPRQKSSQRSRTVPKSSSYGTHSNRSGFSQQQRPRPHKAQTFANETFSGTFPRSSAHPTYTDGFGRSANSPRKDTQYAEEEQPWSYASGNTPDPRRKDYNESSRAFPQPHSYNTDDSQGYFEQQQSRSGNGQGFTPDRFTGHSGSTESINEFTDEFGRRLNAFKNKDGSDIGTDDNPIAPDGYEDVE
jgi:hypothetical protein